MVSWWRCRERCIGFRESRGSRESRESFGGDARRDAMGLGSPEGRGSPWSPEGGGSPGSLLWKMTMRVKQLYAS